MSMFCVLLLWLYSKNILSSCCFCNVELMFLTEMLSLSPAQGPQV